MTMNTIDNSQRTAAKIAGMQRPAHFRDRGHRQLRAAQSSRCSRRCRGDSSEHRGAPNTSSRITVVCFLTYSLGVVVLLTALYVILKPINPGLALAGALFRLVFALLWLLAPLNLLGALRLLSNANYLQVFEPDRLQALARLHLGANFDAYYVGLPFFGLAATVCAWLWLKSNYIPRGLSIFGVISSAWCVLCAFVFLIFPNFNKIVNDYIFDSPMAICSNSCVSLWLLFKGLQPSRIATAFRTTRQIETFRSSQTFALHSYENTHCYYQLFILTWQRRFCILVAGTKQGTRETSIRRTPQRGRFELAEQLYAKDFVNHGIHRDISLARRPGGA